MIGGHKDILVVRLVEGAVRRVGVNTHGRVWDLRKLGETEYPINAGCCACTTCAGWRLWAQRKSRGPKVRAMMETRYKIMSWREAQCPVVSGGRDNTLESG